MPLHLSKHSRGGVNRIKIAASHLHADYVSTCLYPRPRRYTRCCERKPVMRWQRHRRSADKAAFLHVSPDRTMLIDPRTCIYRTSRTRRLFCALFYRSVYRFLIRSQFLKCPLTSVEIAHSFACQSISPAL